jgi:hypothetical protein
MSKMGRYCKAYPVERLQDFGGWTGSQQREPEKEERPESGNGVSGNGASGDGASGHDAQPTENDYLFLQENFTVTKGIFLDEDVVFDDITPQWIDFCKNTLNFEVPADVAEAGEEEAAVAGNSGQQ